MDSAWKHGLALLRQDFDKLARPLGVAIEFHAGAVLSTADRFVSRYAGGSSVYIVPDHKRVVATWKGRVTAIAMPVPPRDAPRSATDSYDAIVAVYDDSTDFEAARQTWERYKHLLTTLWRELPEKLKSRYVSPPYITQYTYQSSDGWARALIWMFALAWQRPAPPCINATRYWVDYSGSQMRIALDGYFREAAVRPVSKFFEESLTTEVKKFPRRPDQKLPIAELVPWPPRQLTAHLSQDLRLTALAAIDFVVRSSGAALPAHPDSAMPTPVSANQAQGHANHSQFAPIELASDELANGSAWTPALARIGRTFEQKGGRHAELSHFISIGTEARRPELLRAAIGEGKELSIRPNGRGPSVPIVLQYGGDALDGRMATLQTGKPPVESGRMLVYDAGFFSADGDLARANAAVDAFKILARRAWEALPETIKRSLRVEQYIDPCADMAENAWQNWVLTLYALAWRPGATSGLKAERKAPIGPNGWFGMEYLIQNPDSPPAGVDPSQHRDHRLLHTPTLTGRTPAQHGITFPPELFVAFLEPDVFLASRQAIEWLAGDQPPAATTPLSESDLDRLGESLFERIQRAQHQQRESTKDRAEASESGGEQSERNADAKRPQEMNAPLDGQPIDTKVWISSSGLKDRCGLTPDQLQGAAKRGRLRPVKYGRLLWYKKTEIRLAYPVEAETLD